MKTNNLLYISGSYPDNQEGIAAGAKVLLDAMVRQDYKGEIFLLTTDTPVISNNIEKNSSVKYFLLKNWRVTPKNVKTVFDIIKKNKIKEIHMEYPGDLYGKTFLASFLPMFVRIYNLFHKEKINFSVRLHEFSRARFLRKVAIMPIALFSKRIYIPAQHDRELIRKVAGKRVMETIIGTNIMVSPCEVHKTDKTVISYFGGVYHGKGIERMFRLWKEINDRDIENNFVFKIIGELNPDNNNHFAEYHKMAKGWLKDYGLLDKVQITGYVTDEEVSREIQNTDIATVLYEDGLTLRRGSFIAYLTHGVPIITSLPDEEADKLLNGVKGVFMTDSDEEIVNQAYKWKHLSQQEKTQIFIENKEKSKYFSWDEIAKTFLRDYGMM